MTTTGFIAERAKTLQLTAFSLAESIRSGSFKSVFRGSGIEFSEVRTYLRGDDVRSIDWNITARTGMPYVKRFREERDVTVFLVLDASCSMDCGTGAVSRRTQSWITTALLAFASAHNHTPFGAVFFDGEPGRVFPPQSGMTYALSILKAMEKFEPTTAGSALSSAIAGAARSLKKRSLVIIVSDFRTGDYEQNLGLLCRRHDVIAVRITDPIDAELPHTGYLPVCDAETGITKMIATSSRNTASLWKQFNAESYNEWRRVCGRCGAEMLEISTDGDPVKDLLSLFNGRHQL